MSSAVITRRSRRVAAAATAVVGMVALTACGGDIPSEPVAAIDQPCGTVNLAVNPWVGYEANAAVMEYVMETRLGCVVEFKTLAEADSWAGFASGEVDVVLENWGHDDLKKLYIDDQQVAVEMGETGNKGIIGWYVPPWLAAAHPDITDYRNLNDYADQFRTTESGERGQLLDGDPTYVTFDEALVANLGLDFSVVYAGSEDALIEAFKTAEEQHQFLIGYFYEPQWFLADVPLVHVTLPPYTPGCDADPATVACDYQPYDLDKVARKDWVDAGGAAVELVKNFEWTNDDQNAVAKAIAGGASYTDAARAWVDANPAKVDAWLTGG